MSSTPNRRLHEDGGNGTGNVDHNHPSALKYSHDDQGTYSGSSGKVATLIGHDYHSPYDMGQDSRISMIVPRNESHDADRRSPLVPNMLFRVPTSNDSQSVRVDSRMEFRDPKDNIKEIKVDNRDLKSDSRELQQSAKTDRCDNNRVDDTKDAKHAKHERDSYSEHKGGMELDKGVYGGSNSQFKWKDLKEQHRLKQHLDGPGGNVETWHMSRTSLLAPDEAAKEGLHTELRDVAEAREAARGNKVVMKGGDKSREKDRKRKEMKHRDWVERDKDKSDRLNISHVGGSSGENKEVQREEREPEKWVFEKNDPLKDKEKLNEKEKINVKRESWNGSDKDTLHNEKELVDIPGKSMEQEFSTLELKKKDYDTWKNVKREARDRKKEREADVESDRPDKRGKFHEKEPEECGMEAEGGIEKEREAFNSSVQQRKTMIRPRGSPQMGNRDMRIRPHSNDNEGPQGQGDASCVIYKIGECMQELIKLWREYELSQADKACESSRNGPTLEIRIPAEHVTSTNPQVRGGQLWGTDVYTVDSDMVAVLMHTGYYRPTAFPPPPATQELRATIRVLPPQDGYISTLRNNVRSRAWGAAIGCSYCVEQCCIVKRGGGIVELEPCLTHSSTMEPTIAPVAAERTMTTRAAASNALRQQRFVHEVTIQFNLCMEPWLKYSISSVADKGLKRSLYTCARLKKGEVLYVETRSCRYELCHTGEKVVKAAAAPHASGVEPGRALAYNSHLANGENIVVDVFRWSRCKRPIPQKVMVNFGIPLPPEKVEVLVKDLEWEDISWSQTGIRIAGRVYHLARTHFISAS